MLIFHFNNLSQPSRALEMFLQLTEIPYIAKNVDLAAGEHFTEEYERINPFKKVPVIEDGEFILTESVAIFRYLCRENSVADHWYPKNSKLRARVDEYLEWQHNETRASCALYFRLTVLVPFITGEQPNEKKTATYKKRVIDVCDKINNIWLMNNKQFIAGDDISIADLMAIAELDQLKMTDYDPCLGRPALDAWMSRVRQRTNPIYDEVNVRINKLALKFKNNLNPNSLISKI